MVVNNYFLPSDLKAFESEYKLPAATINTVGKLQHSADTEATLDVQYITTTGQHMNTTWVYIDGNSPTNPFELWLDWAAGVPNNELPKVWPLAHPHLLHHLSSTSLHLPSPSHLVSALRCTRCPLVCPRTSLRPSSLP